MPLPPPETVHAYKYGAVPPVTDVTIVPLLPPKQLMFVDVAVRLNAGGCVTVTVDSAVQLWASVTLTVTVPAPAPVKATEVAAGVRVAPAVLTTVVKAYGAVPPAAVKLPAPVVAPLHSSAMFPVD